MDERFRFDEFSEFFLRRLSDKAARRKKKKKKKKNREKKEKIRFHPPVG